MVRFWNEEAGGKWLMRLSDDQHWSAKLEVQ